MYKTRDWDDCDSCWKNRSGEELMTGEGLPFLVNNTAAGASIAFVVEYERVVE